MSISLFQDCQPALYLTANSYTEALDVPMSQNVAISADRVLEDTTKWKWMKLVRVEPNPM